MSEATNSGRKLLSATAVMASGTMVSRVLGLIRAVLIAFILGNFTMRADVLTLALTVPSSLYLLLAGGTLNNVLVPQIVRAVTRDEDGGRAFVDRIMTGFLLILGALTVVFTVAAPLVMSVYTKSSWRAPEMAEHWRALLLMSYLTMPQIFFYGVFFLIGQVLNAREKFGPMMWAPVLNNVVSIISLSAYLFFWGAQTSRDLPFTDQQVWLLGIGSTVGIAVQTLILLPYLRRAGFNYRPRFDLKGTGLGRTFHVAKWMVGYVALTSLAQVVVTNMASAGGVNAYQQAYLIWILPHSLLTVSLATAMLPAASTAALAGDLAGVAAETNRALRLALTFLVPASVAFVALADPIARVPFGNGAGASDYHYVAWALAAFGIGLVPYTIQYLYLRAFYALDNTKTPFGLQIWISGANATLAVAFVLAWNDPNTVAARLALAYSVSYFLGVFLTYRSLKRRLPELDGRSLWQQLARLLLASAPAALVGWLITWAGAGLASSWLRLLVLAVAGAAAVAVFVLVARRLGIDEVSSLLSMLRRKHGDDGEADAAEVLVAEEDAELSGEVPLEEHGRPADYERPEPPRADINPDTDPDGIGVFVQVTPLPPPPEAILEYPEPSVDPGTGRVLAGRYRLGTLLAASAAGQSWLGQDIVLGRPVLVQLLPSGAPRTAAVLRSARQAAGATDARFLRVLDVVVPDLTDQASLLDQTDEPPEGAFVVYEYAAGQTLAKLLRRGPLTGVETAWVIREIADAINGLHAQGQHHGQLNPATVLITNSGNLKILGYAAGLDDAAPGTEAGDILALGELLYACLVARWPMEAAFGLHPVLEKDGRLPLPSEVRNGVAPQLDKIVDRLLSVEPRGHAAPIETASELTTQLSLVLGPTSAVSDLRARLNRNADELDSPAPVSRVAPPLPTPAASRFQMTVPVDGSSAESGDEEEFVASALDRQEGFTPVPPPPVSAPEAPEPRKPRLPFVIGTFGLVLAVGLLAAATLTGNPVVVPTTAPPVKLTIIAADDFDPKDDGGSGAENPKLVLQAIDGNPKTSWVSEKYKKTGNFGGTKPGVGLIVDLGTIREVTTVEVMSTDPGGAVQVMVPNESPTAAPKRSVTQWHAVATAADLAADTLLAPSAPVRSRYLLVYLTSLPSIGKSVYQGTISEIAVLGR
ncbi:murein biosynthesis integral membrane protein MurJ [Propionicimonas paludicola]|uniref:Murein biosynthesis integral membrane protein MurJ n=1 Tax=Propionicimonas paludicola TaxID=185243 RepID=A0A2A9CW16_9ACTN|nr:murein biosynthesis integral membrane protein MurJ [Propionicimonas paludicola]PFG18215.1 murein biosynthesis integral membrane protein MurJ [Propionicimonas paludicola]